MKRPKDFCTIKARIKDEASGLRAGTIVEVSPTGHDIYLVFRVEGHKLNPMTVFVNRKHFDVITIDNKRLTPENVEQYKTI